MFRRSLWCACGALRGPSIFNEPMDDFAPGSAAAQGVAAACQRLRSAPVHCPIVIGGKRHETAQVLRRTAPSDHTVHLATGYNATVELAREAVETALEAGKMWRETPFRDRAAIFLRAAHLLSTTYRDEMRAATMLGQGKTAWQAEIDCIAEACDFLRWNVHFAEEMYATQPYSAPQSGVWNRTEYRPLEGFVSAVTPFNFTAIAANLAGTPALLGNVVIWKPSPHAILSNYLMYTIFEAAGLPPGVINFLPCAPEVMDAAVHADPRLAGVVFTGSTRVFVDIHQKVSGRLERYRNFPRLSGETGGKDFHLLHPSADLRHAAAATLRAAFEYQGQKCSACSRLYVPRSVWPALRTLLLEGQAQLRVGQPDEPRSFMTAVIDETAFERIRGYVEQARQNPTTYTLLAGGQCRREGGYWVDPTIIETNDPTATLMREEIFGPVLTVYPYDDRPPHFWKEVCELVDRSTPYGLTGAVFARDRPALEAARRDLRYACGNYYVNDKCTGAVVGQQPFGGGRWSGTNDKPGSALFLTRLVSPQSIKEGFDVTPTLSYPHQLPDVYTL